ncbi:MAG: DUF58 domain-containing protein [Bacteroidota bacterium]
MSNRALIVTAMAYGLIVTALLVRNGGLLSLAIPFLVYLILGAARAPMTMSLSAARTLSASSAGAGEPVEMRIEVRNSGDTLLQLHLRDALPASMKLLEGRPVRQLSLPPGGVAELRYLFSAGRGEYSWQSVLARASDPFGLFPIEQDIPAPGEMMVRPARGRQRQVLLRPSFTLHTSGPIPARRAGTGCNFWGVREYRSGDSLHRLNWRLSARHPRQLFTNEYEREEIADFGLILDARRLTNADAAEGAMFEASVSAAAWLAETFIKQGNRVSLLVFGENLRYVFPGYGKRQLSLVLRALARAALGEAFPIDYLGYMPARLFPSRSVLVVFSPLGVQDLEAYSRLKASGHDVILISPDPVHHARIELAPMHGTDRLALRAARVERALQLDQLARLGVRVIDWQIDQPLEKAIRPVARDMAHRVNL